MTDTFSPQSLEQQQQSILSLQRMAIGSLVLSASLCLIPLWVKLPKQLNMVLGGTAFMTALIMTETTRRLAEQERLYHPERVMALELHAEYLETEAAKTSLMFQAETMQFQAQLQPQPVYQEPAQLPAAQPTTTAIAPVQPAQPVAVHQPQPTQYVDPKYAWADDLMEYETILIYGAPGSGKTSFSAWLMQERKKRGHQLTIWDPHRKYGHWQGLEVVGGGMDYDALTDAIREFGERVVLHYERYQTVPNYNPPRRTTLVEEFTNWATRCKGSGEFFVSTMSDTRKVNECVVYVSHTRTMAGLGEAKGFAATRDASLLELELHAKVDPTTGKAKPALRGTLKYPGGEKREVAIAEWMQGSMDFTDSTSPAPQPQQPATVEVVAEAVTDPKAYRYPTNWPDIRNFTQQMAGRQCCFPGCNYPSTSVHHARYMVNGMSICAAPRPGEDIFPLCDTHHKDKTHPDCAHHPDNWDYGEIQQPLEIDSKNTPEYHQKLRQGWLEKTSQQMVAA